MHSSELEDDEEVGVMGTELLPVNYFNKLVDLHLTMVESCLNESFLIFINIPDDPFVLFKDFGFLFLV